MSVNPLLPLVLLLVTQIHLCLFSILALLSSLTISHSNDKIVANEMNIFTTPIVMIKLLSLNYCIIYSMITIIPRLKELLLPLKIRNSIVPEDRRC